MSAYIIATIDVHDPGRYESYKAMVRPTLEAYGARFVVRGGAAETLEGTWAPKRVVVLEFDSVERARAWWASPEYRDAKALRQASAETQMIVVEGA